MRRKDERVGVCDMGPAVFESGRCVARVTRLREGGKGARNPPVNVPMRAPRKKRRRAGSPEHVRAIAVLIRARLFVALYVLEGSRLGARCLVRLVTRSSDPLVREATAYLRHGEG